MSSKFDTEITGSELFAPLRDTTPGLSLTGLQHRVATAATVGASKAPMYTLVIVTAVMLSVAAVVFLRWTGPASEGSFSALLGRVPTNAMNGASAAFDGNPIPTAEPGAAARVAESIGVHRAPLMNSGSSTRNANVTANGVSSDRAADATTTLLDHVVPEAPVTIGAPRRAVVGSEPTDIRSVRTHKIDDATDVYRLSAGVQAGVLYGGLNTIGGGFALSFEHDWQYVGFRYSSSFGSRGNADQLFGKLSDPANEYTQNVSEYGLLFGATLRQGKFYATFAGGPNYTKSESLMLAPAESVVLPQRYDTTGYRWNGIGFTAQMSFGVDLSNALGLDLTGFVSFHSQVMYGATFLTLKYSFVR